MLYQTMGAVLQHKFIKSGFRFDFHAFTLPTKFVEVAGDSFRIPCIVHSHKFDGCKFLANVNLHGLLLEDAFK